MGMRVTIVNGPRRSGKTTLIGSLVKHVCRAQPHYVRLAERNGTKRPPTPGLHHCGDCGVSTASWVTYDAERVFEVLPLAITSIHRRDANADILMEADLDPNLRHAFPYDCRIFVMPAPQTEREVFRTPEQARAALQSAMNDTTYFTREVYGLGDEDDSSGSGGAYRPNMSDTQMLRLLDSPLGGALAARTRLQREYHCLLESDLVVVNTGIGGTDDVVDEVVQRLEKLVTVHDCEGTPSPQIYCCDPADAADPRTKRLFADLINLCGCDPAH